MTSFSVGVEERSNANQASISPLLTTNAIYSAEGCLCAEPHDLCIGSISVLNGGTAPDPGNENNLDVACVDPGDLVVSGGDDLHLRSGCRCIDAVSCAFAPTADREGTARPQLNSGLCDIGAFEFAQP